MDWKFHIVRMSILYKLIYRFNVIFIEIPSKYFVEIDMIILNLYKKGKKLKQVSQFYKR